MIEESGWGVCVVGVGGGLLGCFQVGGLSVMHPCVRESHVT